MEEQAAAVEMVRGAIRNHHCEVESVEASARWISVLLDADPIVNIPSAATSLKAVLSRRINKMRGHRERLWAPGYAAFSCGEPMAPDFVSRQLEQRGEV